MQNEPVFSLTPGYKLQFGLSHWHKQMLRLLCCNLRELSACIESEAARNPCLEIDYGTAGGGFPEALAAAPEDYRRELRLELALVREGALRSAAAFLIDRLDDDGYLREDLSALAGEGFPLPLLTRALKLIQSFEPAGIGARSPRECFLIQLERRGMQDSDAWTLMTRAYAPLSRGDDAGVLRLMGWTKARLKEARRQLAGLALHPVESAGGRETVVPDAEILPCPRGGFTVRLFDHALPKVSVSRSYLASVGAGGEGGRFAHEGLFYARRFLYCLERRNETLKNALQLAVDAQTPYLQGGEMTCLLMKGVARSLGLHPSVVSRALSNKYVRMGGRVMAAKTLFARECAPGVPASRVKALIRDCIAREDARAPYSDEKLAALLRGKGAAVSRRTVAKYRGALGIAAAAGRRRNDQETDDL